MRTAKRTPVTTNCNIVRLTLDAAQMRGCMEMWRHELTTRESAYDVAIHGRQNRAQILTNLNGTLGGWLDLLRLCRADGHDNEALQQISEEVALFKAWIDEARLAHALLQDAQGAKPRVAARRRVLR